jgi:NADPH:quinone reductase-like Zn-dependent oxidoreductase
MEKRSMEAVVIRGFGAPSVLELGEVALPEPRSGHVRIRVKAAGVNYYDTLVRAGAVSLRIPLPHVMGSDVVGEVDRLGPGVAGLHEGQRVIVAPGYPRDPAEWSVEPENEAPSYFPTGTWAWGGYARFMEVPVPWLLPDDTGMPPEELASIPLVLVTTVHAVKTLAGVGPGSRVLVQAGASGSGSMAIQVAKALGAAVLTTVSTSAKAKLARRLGADEVILYRKDDVAAAVSAWTGDDGLDAVIDPVGGATLGASLASLRPRGVVVNFGFAGGAEARIPHLYPFFRNELRLVGSWMGSMAELRFGLDLVKAGRIQAAVDAVLPLGAAREAHERIGRAEVSGKLVLV